MKKNERLTALLLTLCMSAAALSGCSSTAQAATSDSTAESAVSTDAANDSSKEKGEMTPPEDKLLTLVNDGKLSQETYDSIQKYFMENPPEKPEGMENMGTPSDFDPSKMPEGMKKPDSENGEKPEPPKDSDGNRPEPPKDGNGNMQEPPKDGNGNMQEPPKDGKGPDMKASDSNFDPGKGPQGMGPGMFLSTEMLDKMLSANIITQDEYNTLKEICPEK